ncbi:hypothetical protein C5167_016976 [Papaver somniferum]|uniref:HMG box domain-containing protein n=1 Tax=Papaver somniferum TaxID=3469 RepID=A0A4Y7IM61_PAPSO|nr:high mobility group B protein 9-like [Papaver somniferum]RZC48549.1 hypothetical protein C5167_016976 [Papaver somniferum]
MFGKSSMSSSETETEALSGGGGRERENGVHEDKHYLVPLATHEEIVKNRSVFMETFRHFHSLIGTKIMVPVIGGKELDLHILYVEVTKRGGFEKVVIEKKWRDVGIIFNFPQTATSASYVLRKHYASLLYHYEQVYFFKLQCSPSSVAMPVIKSLTYRHTAGGGVRCDDLVATSSQSMQIQPYQTPSNKTKSSSALQSKSPKNLPVIGTIDGKFDCGYLVSVKLGDEILRGVLYHPPAFESTSTVPTSESAIVPYDPNLRRKRRRRRYGDPDRPKPNRSGYNFFFSEKHSKLKIVYPNREREFTKMIGESWSNLSQEDRMVYQKIGLQDKERYKREMEEYKEKLKLNFTSQGSWKN